MTDTPTTTVKLPVPLVDQVPPVARAHDRSLMAEVRVALPWPSVNVYVSRHTSDVVHSMDIAAAVGAERLREIMTDLVNRAAVVVHRYGGTVGSFTGDGIMAVFGAPLALEDHAVRACLAVFGDSRGSEVTRRRCPKLRWSGAVAARSRAKLCGLRGDAEASIGGEWHSPRGLSALAHAARRGKR